jgi:hypothetical protein
MNKATRSVFFNKVMNLHVLKHAEFLTSSIALNRSMTTLYQISDTNASRQGFPGTTERGNVVGFCELDGSKGRILDQPNNYQLFTEDFLPSNIGVMGLALLLCIPKAPCSNLGPEVGNPDRGFPQSLPCGRFLPRPFQFIIQQSCYLSMLHWSEFWQRR